MSETPVTDAKERESQNCDSMNHAHYGWKHSRKLERLLRECYHSGGLPPELMKRVGEATGRKE